MLSLTPREFEELQIQEFNAMVQGHLRRKRKQDEMQAYFTYWQLLPQLGSKTSITPADILAPLYPDVSVPLWGKKNAGTTKKLLSRRW